MANTCNDCGKEIDPRAKRCASCAAKARSKRRCSEETKLKISEANTGKNNGMWKGDKVGLSQLHDWIRNRKPKPKFCVECKKEKPFDLANVSGEYKREVSDFRWLCRRCHMKSDGRLKNLKHYKDG